jgi:hypothetical protein
MELQLPHGTEVNFSWVSAVPCSIKVDLVSLGAWVVHKSRSSAVWVHSSKPVNSELQLPHGTATPSWN